MSQVLKLHGEGSVVRDGGPEVFEPLDTKNYVRATDGQNMKINVEVVTLKG